MYIAVRIGEFKGANKAQKAAKFLKEKTKCTRRACYYYNMDEVNGYMMIDVYESSGEAKFWAQPYYMSPTRIEAFKNNGNIIKQIYFNADTIPVGEL